MNFYERGNNFAALDLGTTNCRLLIARPAGPDAIRIVDSFSRIVRLGEGVEATGVLSEAAMERTIEALAICAAKLGQRDVARARFVATEACRRASNCAEFAARVLDATGLDLEIISSVEEARLVLAGCAPLLDPHRRTAIIFDIGGGSTEVLWITVRPRGRSRPATRIRGVISVPHGVVSLTERFVARPQTPEVFGEMVDLVRDHLEEFDRAWEIRRQIPRGGVQMLGASGTVTTLAAIDLGLSRYDRARVDGVLLDFDAIERVSAALIGTDTAGRALEPCIGPGRADLMVAGCAILAAICKTWPVGSLRVADRGVREGILAGLMDGARRGPSPAGIMPTAPQPT